MPSQTHPWNIVRLVAQIDDPLLPILQPLLQEFVLGLQPSHITMLHNPGHTCRRTEQI